MDPSADRPRRSRRDLERQAQDHLNWIADLQATETTLRARVAELEGLLTEYQAAAAKSEAQGAEVLSTLARTSEAMKALAAQRDAAGQRAASLQAEVERLMALTTEWMERERRTAHALAEMNGRAKNAEHALAESERKRAEMLRDLIEVKTVARTTCWDWAAKRGASEDYAQKRGWELLTKHVPDTE